MSKEEANPEELARQYADNYPDFNTRTEAIIEIFLAGHSAALRWVPVSERLPEERVKVIGYISHYNEWDRQKIIELVGSKWYDVYAEGDLTIKQESSTPTHWMPLPDGPQDTPPVPQDLNK